MQRRKWPSLKILFAGMPRRVMARVMMMAVISMFGSGVLFFLFYDQLLAQLAELLAYQLLPSEMAIVSEHLPSLQAAMVDWLVIFIGLQLFISGFGGWWLCHKLAGPVLSIRQALERLAAGDLAAEVTLRDGDEMIEVAEAINDCTARIQIMVMGMKENIAVLKQSELTTYNAEFQLRMEMVEQNLAWFETVNYELADEVS
ncbi:HAMP domain-containing protein [Ferrimonas pelagia]|uniref:HAMP domain-containing protein n=1 Tax=Ferrimonas pelagia TaxID=1177826 RepID=A0ABP9FSU7_9GAMM